MENLKTFTHKFFSLLIFFIFFTPLNFAQYTASDSALIHTTYLREFNHAIIKNYLDSEDSMKVNAALLSIAQSEDTSFVKNVINTDFEKHTRQICFTLGEIGPSERSTKFLLSKINSKHSSISIKNICLIALGKLGNKKSFEALQPLYSKYSSSLDAIPLNLYYYFQREIITKDELLNILLPILKSTNISAKELFAASFTLYRAGSSNKIKEYLIPLIKNELKKSRKVTFANQSLTYLMGFLRELKYFPDDLHLFENLINTNIFDVKVEATKLLCYYPFKNAKTLKLYLSLLNDKNPNVSRQAAISIKNIKLDKNFQVQLKNFIKQKLNDDSLTENCRGELFLSYLSLFPSNFEESFKNFPLNLSHRFLYLAASKYNSSRNALNYLVQNYPTETIKNRLVILQSVLEFQKEFKANPELTKFLLNTISSNQPAIISISSEEVDSSFISSNKSLIKDIIIKQANKYKNNSDFYESLLSLNSLSKKIGKEFESKVLNILKSSRLYSVKKMTIPSGHSSKNKFSKEDENFSKFWSNAFKYSYAEIKTSKGSFKIKLLPMFAPISTGNFCLLSQKHFFNNNAFHRVVPGFVVQCGDPSETGWGGPGYDIVSEFSYLNYKTGMVGMASAGKDTEGSQWFVTTGNFPHLNGRYTIFGEVVSGLKNIYTIDQGDKILSINLIK